MKKFIKLFRWLDCRYNKWHEWPVKSRRREFLYWLESAYLFK